MSYPPSPPKPPNKTNKVLGYVIGGLVIGPALAILCPFAGLALGDSIASSDGSNDYNGDGLVVGLIVGLMAPLLIPVPFLFHKNTRPWGVGTLIGAALVMIILGGICAGFIYLLSESHA